MHRRTLLTMAFIGLAAPALAQTQTRPPNAVDPQFTIPTVPNGQAAPGGRALPGQVPDPPATGTVRREGETLSDLLDRTDGVIKPPAGVAPDMTVPAPVPDPGTTLVIPPPGTPGGDPTLRPQ